MIFKNLKEIIAKNVTELEKDISPPITRVTH